MDPVSAKALGGLGNVAGDLAKAGDVAKTQPGGKFEQMRMDKLGGGQQDTLNRVDGAIQNYVKTGRLEGVNQAQPPSMTDRIAAKDGISAQPHFGIGGPEQTQNVWRPQQVQSVGGSEQVASAIKDLNSGQARLDDIIGELRSGKTFTQQELLGLQAEVAMLSEQIQMSTKLVDSAMQSLKQVMQQQV